MCPAKCVLGLGKLNNMRDDLGEPRLNDAPFNVVTNLLPNLNTKHLADGLAHLHEYTQLYNSGRGLQSDRFASRPSADHFLAI